MFNFIFQFIMCFLVTNLSFHQPIYSQEPLEKNEVVIVETILSPSNNSFDCHSSSILALNKNKLITAWKGGPGNGKCNIDMKNKVGIWITHGDSHAWEAPRLVIEAIDSVCWSPVLSKGPENEILLFYRKGPNPRELKHFIKRSYDEGLTWSNEEELPKGVLAPTSKPILLDNHLICPTSLEIGEIQDNDKSTACFIEIFSKNKWGPSTSIQIPGKPFGALGPSLFYLNDHLVMLCRDRSNKIGLEGWIWFSKSFDHGVTWQHFKKTNLPNPDSGICALSLPNGKALVIYNHSHTHRKPLNIAISNDGENWQPILTLEDNNGEFPTATIDNEGFLHITYAYITPGKEQRVIKYVKIDTSKLTK